MHDVKIYAWIGVWLFVLPFFGIPGQWKEILVTLTGLYLVFTAVLRLRRVRAGAPRKQNRSSTEFDGQSQED